MPKYNSRSFEQKQSWHDHYDRHDFETRPQQRQRQRPLERDVEYQKRNYYHRERQTIVRGHQPYTLTPTDTRHHKTWPSSSSSASSSTLSRYHDYDRNQHHVRFYDYQNNTHGQWSSSLTMHDCPTRHNISHKLRSSYSRPFFSSPYPYNNYNCYNSSRRAYMTSNNNPSIAPSNRNDGNDRERGRGGREGHVGRDRRRGRGRERGEFNPTFNHYQHHRHIPPKSYVPTIRQIEEWNSFNSNEKDRPLTSKQAPSESYMALSEKPSEILKEPINNKKLIILDLNGTLASRTSNRQSMYVRPYQDRFLDYIFKHFKVMVWSSAQPHSVNNMCQLFGDYEKDLLRAWDRRYFSLSYAEYNRKSTTLKDLEVVWENIGELDQDTGVHFDATNTILIDDSPAKAILQPYNSIHLCEFDHTSPTFLNHGESELLHVVRYLEELHTQSNVCNFMKKKPFKSVDPMENPNEENEFRAYHYVFGQEGRRLHDFDPSLVRAKKDKYYAKDGDDRDQKHKHNKEDENCKEKKIKNKETHEEKDKYSSSAGDKHKPKQKEKKEEDISQIERQLQSTKL